MKKTIYLIAILTLAACSHNGSENPQKMGLHYLSEVVNDNPGLVLEHLRMMSPDSITNEADKALYGVIYSKALDKEHIYLESDSIIAPALDYYETHSEGNEELLMMAYYYKGRVEYHQNHLVESLSNFLKAEDIANEINDDFYLGLIYRNIARAYNSVYNFVESINYLEKSLEAFKHTGKELYIQYAYYQLAQDLHNNSERDRALEILPGVEKYARETGYDLLLAGVYSLFANIYIGTKEYSKANEYFDKYFAIAQEEDVSTRDRLNAVESYHRAGRTEDAERLYKSFAAIDSGMEYLPNDIYASKGEYEKAYLSLKKEHQRVCRMMLEVFDQGVSRTMSDYKDAKAEAIAEKLRHERTMKGLVVAIAVGIAAGAALWIRRMMRAKARKMANLQAHISELGASLAGANKRLEQSYEEMRKITDEAAKLREKERGEMQAEGKRMASLKANMSRLSVINSLLKEFASIHHEDNDSRMKGVMGRIEKEVNALGTDSKLLRTLEAEMDYATSGMMEDFRKDYPDVRERDRMLLLYLFYGFNLSAISVIQSTNPKAIANRRKRLEERVRTGSSPRRDEYLNILHR